MLWRFKMVLNYVLISLTKDALAMEWSILQWDYVCDEGVINIKTGVGHMVWV